MVGWKGSEAREGAGGIVVAFLLDEPSGRLWEENCADPKNESPDELDGDGDPPRSVRGFILGGIVGNGSEEGTCCDYKFVNRNNGTARCNDGQRFDDHWHRPLVTGSRSCKAGLTESAWANIQIDT